MVVEVGEVAIALEVAIVIVGEGDSGDGVVFVHDIGRVAGGGAVLAAGFPVADAIEIPIARCYCRGRRCRHWWWRYW